MGEIRFLRGDDARRGARSAADAHAWPRGRSRASGGSFDGEAGRREAILALGQEALEGLGTGPLIERAVQLALSELCLDHCQAWERLPAQDRLVLRAGTGCTEAAAPLSIPVDDSLLPGFTLRASSPVTVRDFAAEDRFDAPPPVDRRGAVSGVSVPIPGPDGGFGVLSGHTVERREFPGHDVSFLESLAQLLGAAIQRRQSEERLQAAERKYRDLVERLPVVTYLAEYGPEGRWHYISPQVESMLGYAPPEWMENPNLWLDRIHPGDRARIVAAEECSARDGLPLDVEYRMIARDGSLVWVRDEAAVGRRGDSDVVLVEGVLTNITERKRAEQELRYLAEHDDLTGLFNRRRFEEELQRFRASPSPEARKGAVVILDVDNLKFVNDSLGHATGDTLLRGVTGALRSALRAGEVLARFGGDEFALLLPAPDEEGARRRAAELVRCVRSRDSKLPATASAGAVAFDGATTSTDEDLLVAADIAVQEAKARGGDRVAMFAGGERQRLAWVGQVRAAIDEERLLVCAQPIVDAGDGSLVGSELLVRMRDEDGEVLPPAAFLPTAERFGLIKEIDGWVMDRAIELAEAGLPVGVNLSARSIADPEVTGRFARSLSESTADPADIVFEITETAATTAIEDLRDFGARVERLGCGLAIDDFGTGFGSLTYLKHLPIRYLKIDMEFVRGLRESVADQAIVQSIVTIAGSLGMRTVAEGVENAATLDLLRVYGVDLAQGFHLGRPELVEWAADGRPTLPQWPLPSTSPPATASRRAS